MRLDILRFFVLSLAVAALSCASDDAATKPEMQVTDEQGANDAVTSIDGLEVRRYDLNKDDKPDVLKYFKMKDDEELMVAVRLCLEKAKTLAEPAGASPLAAALKIQNQVRGKKIALILSGGNIAPAQLMDCLNQTAEASPS